LASSFTTAVHLEIIKEVFKKDKGELYLNDSGCFYSWAISSLTTRIRERKKKIETMKKRIEVKENQEPVLFDGGSIYIENDRVIISHDEKPTKDIIKAIKTNGFRWSPKMGNWCRKHTENARYSANYLLANVFGGSLVAGKEL